MGEGDESKKSNKERFEKLKESRQKYKDEAAAAKKRCAVLEEQVACLQATGTDSGAISGSETLELQSGLMKAQQMNRTLEGQLTTLKASLETCQARLAEASAEVKQLRVNAGGAEPAVDDFSKYVRGAMVGAGMVLVVGYVSLCFTSVKR